MKKILTPFATAEALPLRLFDNCRGLCYTFPIQ